MNDSNFQSLDDTLIHEEDNDKLYVTESISEHWLNSSKWTYGIAFIGYIGFGLIVIAMFFLFSRQLSIPVILIFGAISGLVYAIASNFYKFSSRIKNAALYSDWSDMERAFANLNNAYAIYGTCILLVLAGLLVLIIYLFNKFNLLF